jgi:hypothetical protein
MVKVLRRYLLFLQYLEEIPECGLGDIQLFGELPEFFCGDASIIVSGKDV